MSDELEKTRPATKGAIIARSSMLAALGAFIGASCCVLPIILVNLGVSAFLVSKLAFCARAQPYFMGAALILLAAALITAFWNGKRPGRAVSISLVLTTVFLLAAYILPFYEGQLLRWMVQ